ncbi:metallophosphoesterase [Pseudomonas sp. ABFPK]|jgi:predicted MPP superfamily phosphohydrolase|uniref:metallophosphoesterase family protein n=1 Tax=Pseudomonas sp. ABFPK TaxID=1636605 RepID=UPI0009EF6996|nr:metallophosphoesterase [Pseudomonas sp. ABFPK]
MENLKLHWMHISDLHRGQDRTSEVWAVVRDEIHNDIIRQVGESGPLDLVIFSGDMAFKGDSEEFSSVKDELVRLWEVFDKVGCCPKLFLVPGNHDLVRPGKSSALLNFSDILRQKTAVRDEILSGEPSSYRDEVLTAFENYTNFVEGISDSPIPLALDVKGLLPGDCSVKLKVNGLNVGLVGLNSAWTHLAAGNLQEKLDISVRQLNSVVEGDLPKWSRSNHVNLLVTHHPMTWFCKAAKEEFTGEIFNPEYFDAHLFGHMHDNRPELVSVGAHNRRTIQASSLFGLEKVEGKEEGRRHGYYFAALDASTEKCMYWPRKFEQKVGSIWQVSRDGEILSRDEKFFQQDWKVREVDGFQLKKP